MRRAAAIASAAIGIWLMAGPAVLGYGEPALTSDRIAGPLAATFAIISCWAVTRGLLRLNLLIGIWLLLAPWVLGYPDDATWNSALAGAALAALSFVRGKAAKEVGGGWTAVFRADDEAT